MLRGDGGGANHEGMGAKRVRYYLPMAKLDYISVEPDFQPAFNARHNLALEAHETNAAVDVPRCLVVVRDVEHDALLRTEKLLAYVTHKAFCALPAAVCRICEHLRDARNVVARARHCADRRDVTRAVRVQDCVDPDHALRDKKFGLLPRLLRRERERLRGRREPKAEFGDSRDVLGKRQPNIKGECGVYCQGALAEGPAGAEREERGVVLLRCLAISLRGVNAGECRPRESEGTCDGLDSKHGKDALFTNVDVKALRNCTHPRQNEVRRKGGEGTSMINEGRVRPHRALGDSHDEVEGWIREGVGGTRHDDPEVTLRHMSSVLLNEHLLKKGHDDISIALILEYGIPVAYRDVIGATADANGQAVIESGSGHVEGRVTVVAGRR
jgi:hypothetical protein